MGMQHSKMEARDLVFWGLTACVTILAFYCTYRYSFAAPIKALIWLVWFVLAFVFGFFTTQGKRLFVFAQDAKLEMQKVVWPTKQETVQTTTIVMVMVAVTGFVLWGIDSCMMWAIGKLTHLG